MRTRFLVFTLLFSAVALACILWLRPGSKLVVPAEMAVTNQAAEESDSVPVAADASVPSTSATQYDSTRDAAFATNLGLQSVLGKMVNHYNQPILFFGKVVDQDSNALAGVTVRAGVRHTTMPHPSFQELVGSRQINLVRTTDAEGRFEISGVTGDVFGMIMEKAGYQSELDSYGSGPVGGTIDDPVVFKMWSTNIHERLISGERRFSIIPDGRTYGVNLTEGVISDSQKGDLQIWIKRPENVRLGQKYNWACGIDVINGGLQEAGRESPYEAPAEGYMPRFRFEQLVGSGWGDTTGKKIFFVSLRNGSQYGKITIELCAFYNEKTPAMIRLTYVVNPSGSRILR